MQALSGVVVIVLEQAFAAPLCTSRFAEAGARVAHRHDCDALIATRFRKLGYDWALAVSRFASAELVTGEIVGYYGR